MLRKWMGNGLRHLFARPPTIKEEKVSDHISMQSSEPPRRSAEVRHERRHSFWSKARRNALRDRSEIRPVRGRDRRVLFGAVFAWIFGAHIFQPFAERASIGYGRRPRHRE